MSWASTVDIIADIGAARKIPATIGGNTCNIRLGITLSDTVKSGTIARPNAPAKCIPNMMTVNTIVPISIPLCRALLSLNAMQRTAVCGKPTTPKQTKIQKDAINWKSNISFGPYGLTRLGSISVNFLTALSTPPT